VKCNCERRGDPPLDFAGWWTRPFIPGSLVPNPKGKHNYPVQTHAKAILLNFRVILILKIQKKDS